MRNLIIVPPGSRRRFLLLEQEATQPLVALGVRMGGIGSFLQGYRIEDPDPPNHLVLVTLEGQGRIEGHSQRVRPLEAFDALILPAGEPLAIACSHGKWTFVWFYLRDLSRWHRMRGAGLEIRTFREAEALRASVDGLLVETGWTLSQKVWNESGWLEPEAGPVAPSGAVANLHGQLAAEYLLRLLEPETPRDEDREALDALWDSVAQEPAHSWTQAEMARRLNVSVATLQRRVRTYEQSSPRQVVIRIRMQVAKRLLRQTRYGLESIADQVGYADGFGFSNAFKRETGMSPKEYRGRARH